MIRSRVALWLSAGVFVLSLLVPPVLADSALRRFSSDDVQRIVGLSSPQISPDGTHAVVVVSHIDTNGDTYRHDIDLIDLRSHTRRTLTNDRKGLSDPAFSPSGDRLAFLADEGTGDGAKTQVFVLRMDGGDARPVTKAPEGVEQFAWRPDGAALAYVAEDEKPKKTGADKFRDSFDVGNNPITAHAAARPLHLWLLTFADDHARQLTRDSVRSIVGGEAQSSLSWSHDGTRLAFVLAPDAILNDADRARVMVLDIPGGAMHALTEHTAYEADPQFSPDGSRMAYEHSLGDSQITLTQVYVTQSSGGEGRPLSEPFDRSVHDFTWSPDGRALWFTCNDGSRIDLVRVPLGGKPQRVDLGDVEPTSPLERSIARDGAMVFVGTSVREPSELYYRPARGGAPVKVTNYNDSIASLDLGRSETVPFKSDTGIASEALLLEPPGFTPSRTYPLVLEIHGGPTSASTAAFDRLGQLMAARGWLVLRPNYRGSDNHGLAYQSAVRYDPEAGPGRDIAAALAAVRARGIVDEKRIAVSGWSYGGIMTAWMITHYHDWKAAVSGASVNDWSTDYSVADDSGADAALFHGSPWSSPQTQAEYERASAVNYAKDVTTPVLILSDVGDNRDPIATSYEFYHALKDNGKDVTFTAWPVPGHFPNDPVRTLDVYEHWIDYIAGHF
ncbi:MAG: S9 family peptidase [Candidatus Eremiobacteraeota bacterium]|nr:S9 family peptidase [Candidatus Eremiobacteraeota bacterium]MBC5804451.1 S9 family peptidase [Candidatus Eremiobacteraeota bacterium]MBC5821208.1 S9 family peptidase [Candidatus Eremiobacteraeota bacterium]